MKQQTGLALVIVLWVVSLLKLMAASFALTVRRETMGVSALKEQAGLQTAAESGVILAQTMLTHADTMQRWLADGRAYTVAWHDYSVEIRSWAEQGKLDINKADENQLQRLLQNLNFEPDQQAALADALMDWRDEDDWVRMNGAEKLQYQQQDKLYEPANRPFDHLAQLRMVLGFDDEVYTRLAPFITVYSGQSQVDLHWASTAMKAVWQAMEEDFSTPEDNNNDPTKNEDGLNLTQGMVITVLVIASSDLNDGHKAIIQAVLKYQGAGRDFVLLNWQQGSDQLMMKDNNLQDIGQSI